MDKEIYVLGIGRNSITMIDLAEDCGYRIRKKRTWLQGRKFIGT